MRRIHPVPSDLPSHVSTYLSYPAKQHRLPLGPRTTPHTNHRSHHDRKRVSDPDLRIETQQGKIQRLPHAPPSRHRIHHHRATSPSLPSDMTKARPCTRPSTHASHSHSSNPGSPHPPKSSDNPDPKWYLDSHLREST